MKTVPGNWDMVRLLAYVVCLVTTNHLFFEKGLFFMNFNVISISYVDIMYLFIIITLKLVESFAKMYKRGCPGSPGLRYLLH